MPPEAPEAARKPARRRSPKKVTQRSRKPVAEGNQASAPQPADTTATAPPATAPPATAPPAAEPDKPAAEPDKPAAKTRRPSARTRKSAAKTGTPAAEPVKPAASAATPVVEDSDGPKPAAEAAAVAATAAGAAPAGNTTDKITPAADKAPDPPTGPNGAKTSPTTPSDAKTAPAEQGGAKAGPRDSSEAEAGSTTPGRATSSSTTSSSTEKHPSVPSGTKITGTAPGEIVIPPSLLAEAKEAAARRRSDPFETAAAEHAPRKPIRNEPADAGPARTKAEAEAEADKAGDGKAGDGKPGGTPAAGLAKDDPPTGPATDDRLKPEPIKTESAQEEPVKGGGHIDLDKPVVVTVGSSSGRRVTRVLRHANPIKVARTAGRSTHAWAKRPAGRLIVPAIIAALLLGAAGTAGAYLVPQALEAAPSPSATPGFPLDAAAPGPSGAAALPSVPPVQNSAPVAPVLGGARPADALAGWAQGVGTRVGIPVVAVQAYGYAELVAARTAPNCRLSWTTIAAIAKVESSHGSANGAVLGADGAVQPPVLGLPLDGKGGRQLIRDTDQGVMDGDRTYDRAVGPLQFIPATWREMQVDADNNQVADPNDIDDASLAAALYLCRGGRNLSRADAWWEAILSYNAVQPYAQKVFDAANEYGRRSRV